LIDVHVERDKKDSRVIRLQEQNAKQTHLFKCESDVAAQEWLRQLTVAVNAPHHGPRNTQRPSLSVTHTSSTVVDLGDLSLDDQPIAVGTTSSSSGELPRELNGIPIGGDSWRDSTSSTSSSSSSLSLSNSSSPSSSPSMSSSAAAVSTTASSTSTSSNNSLWYTAKRKVGTKLAGSTWGKNAIKATLSPVISSLVDSIQQIVRMQKPAEVANDVEVALFKVAVKTYLLLDSHLITLSELLRMDAPLRTALLQLRSLWDRVLQRRYSVMRREHISDQELRRQVGEVARNMTDALVIFQALLAQHLKERTMARVRFLSQVLIDVEFIMVTLNDRSMEEPLNDAMAAIDNYTAFSFYDED
jgi:hypothetical protein